MNKPKSFDETMQRLLRVSKDEVKVVMGKPKKVRLKSNVSSNTQVNTNKYEEE